MKKIKIAIGLLVSSFLICSCAIRKQPQNMVMIPSLSNSSPTKTFKLTSVKATLPPGALFYDDFASGANTPWTFYQGTRLFTNGVLRLSVGYNAGMYAYVRTNFTNNITVQADVRQYAPSWGAAVGVRYNWTNGANYQCWLYQSNNTSWPGRLTIEKYSNWYNTWTQLAGANIPDPGTNWHNIRLDASNNVFTAYLDGVQMLNVADGSPFMNYGGIDLSVWGGLNAMTAEFDNVLAYPVGATPIILAPPSLQSVNIRQIVYQGNDVNFSVNATGNPLNYQWYYANKAVVGATNSSYVVTNIQPANQGNYSVAVFNNLGNFASYGTLSVLTTNILPQCAPIVSNLNPSVAMAWCPSDGTNVAGYKIYWGSGFAPGWMPTIYDTNGCPAVVLVAGTNLFGSYTNSVDVGMATNTTITNLVNLTTYYFACTAYDPTNLESDFSNEIQYTTPGQTITWPVLKSYGLTIRTLYDGTPEIQTKVCPYQSVTLQYKTNIVGTWFTSTNVTADAYGNVLWDDTTAPIRFYRSTTP